MMGVPLTSRAMVAAAAVPLLLLSAPQSSTAFVLRPASLSTLPERSVLERRTSAAATTANARSRGRPRTAVALLISPTNPKASREARLMMASEPVDEVPTAEEAAASEEPSIPPPEEGGAAAEDADATAEEAAEEGEEMPEAGEGETEVVAEEEGEDKEEEEEEEEEEKVDPMAEVKERIKELEKQLILEENKLRDAQDSVQEKGQMGFLRMAAQVDNFRKTSGAGTGDYEADAKAAVLTAMLPAFEPFEAAEEALKMETENEIKFNKSYQALYRQLKDVYTKIGATDYFGVVGEKFVYTRHEKASEEHNPIMKEGLIIKCLSPGLELKKNVIRKAVCVVSLGPEKKPEEAKPEAEEGKEEAGDAPADAAAAASAEEGGAGSEVEGAEKEEGVVEEEAPPLRDAGAGGADADEDAEGEPTADA